MHAASAVISVKAEAYTSSSADVHTCISPCACILEVTFRVSQLCVHCNSWHFCRPVVLMRLRNRMALSDVEHQLKFLVYTLERASQLADDAGMHQAYFTRSCAADLHHVCMGMCTSCHDLPRYMMD